MVVMGPDPAPSPSIQRSIAKNDCGHQPEGTRAGGRCDILPFSYQLYGGGGNLPEKVLLSSSTVRCGRSLRGSELVAKTHSV